MNAQNRLAVFDFDSTLVEGDSLVPFLKAAAGTGAFLTAFAEAATRCVIAPAGTDRRTFMKAHVLHRLLAGRSQNSLQEAVEATRAWLRWKPEVFTALRRHIAQGHRIVIASGGLDLYLPALLDGIPHTALLCTRMEIVGGIVTGRMESGNCVRAEKARRVAAWIKAEGPFAESWGYGNAPHDLPMLALTTHPKVVT